MVLYVYKCIQKFLLKSKGMLNTKFRIFVLSAREGVRKEKEDQEFKLYATMENSMEVPYKTKIRTAI